MILAGLIVGLAFVLGLYFVFRPLRGEAMPFPKNPRPDELRAELSALKEEAKSLQGPERTRVLKRMAWIERELGQVADVEAPAPKRFPRWVLLASLVAFVGVSAVLIRYTLPRLPGSTVTESLALEQASKLKELLAKAEKSGSAEDWLAYADFAFESGDLNRAAEGYSKVIKLDPKNIKAYRRFGILLSVSGKTKEAIQILSAVVERDSDPEGLLFLGNAYFKTGDYNRAIEAWREYLKRGGTFRDQVLSLMQMAQERATAKDLGAVIYAQSCAACHGALGEGGSGPALAKNSILNAPEAVKEIVLNGRGTMPPILMNDKDFEALMAYLKKL